MPLIFWCATSCEYTHWTRCVNPDASMILTLFNGIFWLYNLQVTSFLFFLSKVLVTLGMGACTYFYLSSEVNQIRLNYLIVPSIVVMIGTYLISTVFFGVYSMAVDTLFLCFRKWTSTSKCISQLILNLFSTVEDCERNDGSAEKPYFMSKGLMRILGNKNEEPRHHYE